MRAQKVPKCNYCPPPAFSTKTGITRLLFAYGTMEKEKKFFLDAQGIEPWTLYTFSQLLEMLQSIRATTALRTLVCCVGSFICSSVVTVYSHHCTHSMLSKTNTIQISSSHRIATSKSTSFSRTSSIHVPLLNQNVLRPQTAGMNGVPRSLHVSFFNDLINLLQFLLCERDIAACAVLERAFGVSRQDSIHDQLSITNYTLDGRRTRSLGWE